MRALVITFSLIIHFLFSSNLFAGTSGRDTIPKEAYKISKKEFLEKYGTDDTARALIKYFFSKRIEGKNLTYVSGLGMMFLIFTVPMLVETGNAGSGANLEAAAGGLITIFLIVPSMICLPFGIMEADNYSKKNLYKALINYQSGNGVTSKYKKGLLTYMKHHPSV